MKMARRLSTFGGKREVVATIVSSTILITLILCTVFIFYTDISLQSLVFDSIRPSKSTMNRIEDDPFLSILGTVSTFFIISIFMIGILILVNSILTKILLLVYDFCFVGEDE